MFRVFKERPRRLLEIGNGNERDTQNLIPQRVPILTTLPQVLKYPFVRLLKVGRQIEDQPVERKLQRLRLLRVGC